MVDAAGTHRLGLHTDLYEIRMVESYVRREMFEPATFSLFSRPSRSRPWLVAAGMDRVLEVLGSYRFGPEELDYLAGQDTPDDTLDYLRDLQFEGEVWAVPDGTLVLGDEPLVEVTAPLPVAQLLETAVMNAVHFDTLIATKAARCVRAADGRAVVDFGFRRAYGLEAGNRAARAAYLGGIGMTSNVEAGRRSGLPITGTMAHSFVQAFDDEREAFRVFTEDHPGGTTLLVDTYDLERGVDNAIAVAQELANGEPAIRAIRIDSDPLDEFARWARERLDGAGLDDVQIFLSGSLDEFSVDELVSAGVPVDGFGIGSALVTSSDQPALDVAYKLVSYAGRGRAKYSRGKRFLPGAKQVFRSDGPGTDVLELRGSVADGRPLLQPIWKGREPCYAFDLETARDRATDELATIPDDWDERRWDGDPPAPRIGPELDAYADEVAERELP